LSVAVHCRALKTLWFCLLLAMVPPAAAQSTSSRIVLTYDPTSEEQRRALAAVRAHLRGLPIEIVTETVEQKRDLADRLAASGTLASSHAALGTFSIEKGADRSILVFLTEPGGSATLVRHLPASELSVRVAIEQAAIVIRSLVAALLEGGRLGVTAAKTEANAAIPSNTEAARSRATPETTRGQPKTPVPANSSTPVLDTERAETEIDETRETEIAETGETEIAETEEIEIDETAGIEIDGAPRGAPPRFFLALGYAGVHPGGGLAWQSGAAVGARWLLAARVAYIGVRYTLLLPASEIDVGSARVSIVRRPAELVLGFAAGSWVLANAELCGIVEQATRETVAVNDAFEPTQASTHWGFGLGPRVGAMLAPWPDVRLAARAGADFMLTQTAYATDEETVRAPGRVRPRLEFEVAIGVW
jgi:hypothetical protein